MAKVIGITGGIGSGKSIVCKFFELLQIPVYYADARANWLTNNDLQLRKEIKELLGRQAYDQDGLYNRKWVAEQVFTDPSLLQMLNLLIHPRVLADTQNWLEKNQNQSYVLREAAISNAAKQGNDLDKIIVVSCPEDIRIKRIKQRDPQRSETQIKAIIARQKTEEEFASIADYIIQNDEKKLLIPQILAIHQQLNH
ncbi:Dephospho-CoA kinase [Emticicia oligotrophica DSM 17448]|uniref:Dephospho-CoA kinase n=1 Tax=Emticicia oligotrophica (strain DSM 17448 / CIP 109782 / MTCC 6937 / GPTSA100-15) TaxID=929562 RepID=A0ABN4ANY3_EMTOG|nr:MULTISPECIES: dephospho-CoA kinase [Emticicia]AFK04093.1 Dephospho-CoA kinase [Emticicia oligotrophica DSM 17448]